MAPVAAVAAGQVDRPAIAVPFSYSITGWGLSDVDRIRIVDSTTICGQAGAEVQRGGLGKCWSWMQLLGSVSPFFRGINVWYSNPQKKKD